MSVCPESAVEAGHSWAVILLLIITTPAAAWILNRLEKYLPIPPAATGPLLRNILDLAWIYLALFGLYYPFHRLSRLKWMGNFLRMTTLTRFFRRYPFPSDDQ